jgi:hypothetical protein
MFKNEMWSTTGAETDCVSGTSLPVELIASEPRHSLDATTSSTVAARRRNEPQ